ncbi:MAG: hypothetical protein WA771_11665, partial [Chthoniobacterales bacterium]
PAHTRPAKEPPPTRPEANGSPPPKVPVAPPPEPAQSTPASPPTQSPPRPQPHPTPKAAFTSPPPPVSSPKAGIPRANPSRSLALSPSRHAEIAARPVTPTAPAPYRESAAAEFNGVRKVQFDVGERMRSVLMAVIVVCGIVTALGILAYTYLVINEDPGVKHHRLQNELMQSQRSR